MISNPKHLAQLLAKAALLMAMAQNPGISEVERVGLLHRADMILEECGRASFSVDAMHAGSSKGRVY